MSCATGTAATFLSSSTIGLLLHTKNLLESQGRTLTLHDVPPSGQRLLDACGLTDQLEAVGVGV
ncbi:hypothetical protein BH23ACT9_BH23ACT9_07770 [soil metagenome]